MELSPLWRVINIIKILYPNHQRQIQANLSISLWCKASWSVPPPVTFLPNPPSLVKSADCGYPKATSRMPGCPPQPQNCHIWNGAICHTPSYFFWFSLPASGTPTASGYQAQNGAHLLEGGIGKWWRMWTWSQKDLHPYPTPNAHQLWDSGYYPGPQQQSPHL